MSTKTVRYEGEALSQADKLQIFKTELTPLIIENDERRMAGDLPDEWFWADKMGI